MASITSKKNIFLVPAMSLLILTAAAYMGMHWYISFIKSTAEEKISSIVQDDQKAMYGHKLANILKEIEPYSEELAGYGVNSEEIVGFINKVEGLSAKSGATVSIASINVPDEAYSPNTPLQPAVLNINISGSWASVIRAVQMFENFPYRTNFDKVRLVKSGADDPSGKSTAVWQAQFEMSVLRLK